MNITDVQKLTDDQINSKIATFNGWTVLVPLSWDEVGCCVDSNGKSHELIPNYAKDLNAIQNAILDMTSKRGTKWLVKCANKLAQIVGHNDHMEIDIMMAEARMRCEAFILAMDE